MFYILTAEYLVFSLCLWKLKWAIGKKKYGVGKIDSVIVALLRKLSFVNEETV